jgi:serine/threonine protein kinase
MSSPDSSQPSKGTPRVGSYRLLQPLGTGGMSSVFHAVHTESGHEVAVKILPKALAKNPTLLQRFLREAKSAETLEHPNIAAIYDRGFDQGRHYLVLEYVEGGDLHERVRSSGPLDPREAVKVVRAVAEGLHFASTRGVIHRDVKPANLLLTPQGQVKIIDLGLALQTENEDERVTRDGTTVGTVDYMSPEQARDSRATSERSDIYSLGCTFYFLLTGKPPYPGGDVPDKLGRHCTAPIPDVRALRAEISEPLATLIMRMMAKKPEARFVNYEALIAALDELPESRSAELDEGKPLDVLIADDDDDEISGDGIPFALSGPPISPAAPGSSGRGERTSRASDPAPLEVSLADLAELDVDELRSPRARPRQSPAGRPAIPDEVFEPSDPEATTYRTSGRDVPLSTWIAAGAIIGLAIAFLGFGVLQVLGPKHPTVADVTLDEGAEAAAIDPDIPNESSPMIRPRPVTPPATGTTQKSKPKPAAIATIWTEPADPPVSIAADRPFPPEVESGAIPAWAREPIPTVGEGTSVTLRRVVESSDASHAATLRQALDTSSGVIEIADNGPFFEDDCRIGTKSRIIRARPGFRPVLMIRLNAASLAIVRDRPAVFSLDGNRLVMDGLDLVVDARELSVSQTALFQLRGAELTLHDCTVTILSAGNRPFSMLKIDDAPDERPERVSQIRLDRTLVRVWSPTAIDFGGPGDVVLNQSAILGGAGSVVSQRATTTRGARRIFLRRSAVATRGTAFDIPGGRGTSLTIRSTGTTFAKVAGVNDAGLIRARTGIADSPLSVLEWIGRENHYVGWLAWLSVTDLPRPLITSLVEAQSTWRGGDIGSTESRRAWPGTVVEEDASIDAIRASVDDPTSALWATVSPSPSLLQSTARSFPVRPLPPIPARAMIREMNGAIASNPAFLTKSSPAIAKSASPAGNALKPVELSFNVADPAWRGDLGHFLSRSIPPGSMKVVVKISGGGRFGMTPIRLPDGASVEIEAVGSGGAAPTWSALPGKSAPALIALSHGSLSLKGVHLLGTSRANIPHLVRVDDGNLLISHAVIGTGEGILPPGFGLVLIRAAGTSPRANDTASPSWAGDRPTLLVVDSVVHAIGGEAISAELGRGMVRLMNSVIVSEAEGTAIGLAPQRVARTRFDADLILEHCSIASERSLVRIGPWLGSAPGPNRPWLVSSRRTAFFEIAQRGHRESVLLRTKGEGLPHGSIFWQADGDAYDLPYFTISGDDSPSPGRQRPDVKSQWIDFWGANHIANVIGPTPRRTEPVLTLQSRDRTRPAPLSAEAFQLDPKSHRDLGADLRFVPRRKP